MKHASACRQQPGSSGGCWGRRGRPRLPLGHPRCHPLSWTHSVGRNEVSVDQMLGQFRRKPLVRKTFYRLSSVDGICLLRCTAADVRAEGAGAAHRPRRPWTDVAVARNPTPSLLTHNAATPFRFARLFRAHLLPYCCLTFN